MKKQRLITAIGRTAFWLTWPLLFIYLFASNRTRVIIAYEDKILVVSTWLGSGRWILPGGGLHANERPVDGAIREVFEETGLQLSESALRYLGNHRVQSGLRFRYDLFVTELSSLPTVTPKKNEIATIQWLPIANIINPEPATKEALAIWRETQDLVH